MMTSMIQMLQKINPDGDLDIRDLLAQKTSIHAFHKSGDKRSPKEIERNYELDKRLIEPVPKIICIVDDVLTTGAHFKAARNILSGHFPNTDIVGLFIARRVSGDPEFSEVDL